VSLTVGSLFSGVGGLDLGLERAGMELVWSIEKNYYNQCVLDWRWPDEVHFSDVKRTDPRYLPRVDLVAGGPPCQPVSVAGRKRAEDDERWLWPHFARIVRILRPRYVLLENPPGLFARGFNTVVGDLSSSGYCIEWETIPAAAFGALQLRFRILLVAYPDSVGCHRRPGVFGSRGRQKPTNGDPVIANPHSIRQLQSTWRQREQRGRFDDGSWWAAEPGVARMVYGLPHRVDRVRALGNAVIPQMGEWVGRLIAEHSEAC
jgi:DNA (cytosine-5)-methyltransferase 1